jgi:hypothetical protein
MAEDYCIRLVKELIAHYKMELDNADSTEKVIYSIVIEDLKGILVDLIHH